MTTLVHAAPRLRKRALVIVLTLALGGSVSYFICDDNVTKGAALLG